MKKISILTAAIFSLIHLTSCIEDIEIDPQEGPQLIGINAYFTNEYKKHQLVLSKTMDFYSTEDREMISDAEVFIYDGFDTIFYEETEQKGYYETIDSVAGVIGHTYNLHVSFIDDEGEHSYYAQSTMRDNAEKIDSLAIKEYSIGNLEYIKLLGLFPYFQSTTDSETTYLVNISVNDSLYEESLIKCSSFFLGGLSGMYVNSDEMIELIGEQAVYTFPSTSYYDMESDEFITEYSIKEGDTITMYMYSITREFSTYISDINSNFGSNPMMGMPYNVSTNIYPEGNAVGFFEATSLIKADIIY